MTRGTLLLLVILAACGRRAENGDTTRAKPDIATGLQASQPATTPAAPRDSAVAKPAPRPVSSAASNRDSSTTPAKSPTKVQAVAMDTLRGIVAVVGTEHDKHVVIRPAGGRAVTLSGALAALVGRASGADVWVSGTSQAGALTVTAFSVRTVDGIAALDGTLMTEGNGLVLQTPDGKRHPIANPPEALRQHVGGRVWISGNLNQGPVAYGIIQDKL